MPTGRGRAPFVSIAQRYVWRGRSSQAQLDLGPEAERVACAHDPAQADLLTEALEAFNRHDLDAIMAHFAEDCVLETPRGPDPSHATATSSPATVGCRNGRSPARPSRVSGSRCGAATCGRSEPTTRSPGRTRSGSS